MEWFGYTVGVVAHAWAFLALIKVMALLGDPRVKIGLYKVNLEGTFFVPWIGILGFWMWVIYG
jgi:hypothetical protein